MPEPSADVAALRRQVRRTSLLAAGAANVVGALVVAVYVILLGPGERPEDFRLAEAAVLWALLVAVMLPAGDAVSRRLARDASEALWSGRPLDSGQRAALVRVPWRAAMISLTAWTVSAVAVALYDRFRLDDHMAGTVWTFLIVFLGGLTTSALVFLLNEHPLRPMYARAFRDARPTRAEGLAVGVRLTLVWALGAGVPLLGIALAFLGVNAGDFESVRRGVLVLVAVGLVAGFVIVLRASRSIAQPLAGLRDALDRVRHGDLGVEVPVDDLTEIGLLQAGFNEMVAGLRERARLEDLFGRHVGVEVAQEALRRGVRLGGQRTEVSALFVDVAGSTRLAVERPPEEVVEMLNGLFEAVARTAKREGGWINKFAGDAALCVFGAPVEQPDHAARALRAANALRAEVTRLAEHHPGLDAGIGVSSGDAVAGNIGTEERYEYTVIGDPVNEAARLTEEAKSREGRVLASEATVSRAGDEASNWEEAVELRLRGRSAATVAYEPHVKAAVYTQPSG